MNANNTDNMAAVVIPYYHNDLDWVEETSINQVLKVLNKHDLILLCPKSLKIQEKYSNLTCVRVEDYHMDSVQSYNQMMLSLWFYELFCDYEYILIYQLDAFVFSDRLMEFCRMGYDYVGAPWLRGGFHPGGHRGVYYIGNGGFSLRKINSFINILNNNMILSDINEDLQFAMFMEKGLNVAPLNIALQFSYEEQVDECFRLNGGKLPFGCHAWSKMNFETWRPYFEQLGIDTRGRAFDKLDNVNVIDKHYLYNINSAIYKKISDLSCDFSKSIYIYGAGRLGIECGWVLNKLNIEYKGFIDNNPEKNGTVLQNHNIFMIDDVARDNNGYLFIVSVKDDIQCELINNSILKIFAAHGVKVVNYKDIVNYRYFDYFRHDLDDFK